jgi:hypothetical protein
MAGIENRTMGTVFWAKKERVTRGWRKVHNEELVVAPLAKYH